jgi:hypothetical protein
MIQIIILEFHFRDSSLFFYGVLRKTVSHTADKQDNPAFALKDYLVLVICDN